MSVVHEIGIISTPYYHRKGRVQCSFSTHRSHQAVCLACRHQINHWGLLKIHRFFLCLPASTSLRLFLFPYFLSAVMCHSSTIVSTSAGKKKTGPGQFKRLISINLLSFNSQRITPLPP